MIKIRTSQNISCHNCSVKHLCMGADLTFTDLERFDQLIINIKSINKKEHIYWMNTPVLHLYAIYRGSCKEYWIDENGNECVTNFYFPGDIIGIESTSRQKYMFSTVALEDIELCAIPINHFLEVMQQTPTILKRFN